LTQTLVRDILITEQRFWNKCLGGMDMYTASGGYYLDGSSFNKKKLRSNKTIGVQAFRLFVILTFFILSFIFGAVMNAYATTEENLSVQVESMPLESIPLYDTHIVDSGESLWTIAKQNAPGHIDIRDYVNEIILLNELDTNVLFIGQRLLLP